MLSPCLHPSLERFLSQAEKIGDEKLNNQLRSWINDNIQAWVRSYQEFGSSAPSVSRSIFEWLYPKLHNFQSAAIIGGAVSKGQNDREVCDSNISEQHSSSPWAETVAERTDIPIENDTPVLTSPVSQGKNIGKNKGKWTVGMPKTKFVEKVNKLEKREILTRNTLDEIIKRGLEGKTYQKLGRQTWRFNLADDEFAFLKDTTVAVLMAEDESDNDEFRNRVSAD